VKRWDKVILGVYNALLPAVFVVRTANEDEMLREELAGYEDYARGVRYRLVPGIW
jgi:protein-S-isoprenylcysteine O-methyltransferase Ste14